jgi:hypothetical protein
MRQAQQSYRKVTFEDSSFLTAQSLAADFQSESINIEPSDKVCIQCVWTGDAVGTFSLDMSLDGTNWVSKATSAVAAAGTCIIDMESGAKYARLSYVSTSGTGSLSVSYLLKSYSA